MQIDRLLQIVFLLLSHEYLTARQLAEELNVSARTIYRDINILSLAGIPITSQKGYNGGLTVLTAGLFIGQVLFHAGGAKQYYSCIANPEILQLSGC